MGTRDNSCDNWTGLSGQTMVPLSHYLQILCRISILTTRVDHFFRNLAYHRNLDMLLRCCLPQLTVLYEHVQMQRKRWWFLNLQILCWISILTTRVNHFLCNLANHRNRDMLWRSRLPQLTVQYCTSMCTDAEKTLMIFKSSNSKNSTFL